MCVALAAKIFLSALTRFIFSQIVKKSQAGGGVAVKIEHAVYQSSKMFGRHFDDKDELYSRITRQSIDVLKVRAVVACIELIR
jgi:predicted lactoylglutathione lyase